jgi:hypothetical protein
MPMREVRLAIGRTVEFNVGEPGPLESTCFVLGVRKCGSSIMNSMLRDLARLNGRHFVDVAGAFFKANVIVNDWRNDPASLDLLVPGQVYGGFRAMPMVFAQSPIFRAARKILLVRDPRDALVSEYYSTAYTHSLPAEGVGDRAREVMLKDRELALRASIDAFAVQKTKSMNRTIFEYRDVAGDPLTKVFRYEDVILNKRAWVRDIISHFGWEMLSPAALDGMMSWADVIPEAERPTEFVRQVRPGNHREKLSPEVIAQINVGLKPCMDLFGYE